MILRGLCALCGLLLFATSVDALKPDILRSSGAVPAHVAGRFREPTGFQQSASGQYFVFDRRAHTVYGLDPDQSSAWEIIQIGGEARRIVDSTAFASEPNLSVAVSSSANRFSRAGDNGEDVGNGSTQRNEPTELSGSLFLRFSV